MMEMPWITVVTISYNSAAFIRETIESVLEQSYTNFEFLISDDCSSDDSWSIIESYNDTRIRAFRNSSNLGEYANRNKCINLSLGEYLIFIDGDDVMYHNALEVYSTYTRLFPAVPMIVAKDYDYRIKYPYLISPENYYRFEFFDTSLLANFTKILFKTSFLLNYCFPLNIKTGDSYIQLKIAEKNSVLLIPDGLTWWRSRTGSASLTLFANSLYHAEVFNYKLSFLSEDCPLRQKELELAKFNIYGIYLRIVVRLILKLEFKQAIYLIKSVHIPKRYIKSIFSPRVSGYFSNITGDNPFHSTPTHVD